MTTGTKIYIALGLAAIIGASLAVGSSWSAFKVSRLEKEVALAKTAADAANENASLKELEAAGYKQKIEYLETQLADIRTIATKQDEQLEKLNTDSRNARDNVERAKRTRAIAVTHAELCAKLAELGHACH